MKNQMRLEFDSISANEAFARVTTAAFMTQMNPSMEEVADVKTAVSEAVTNAIIHGYRGEVHKIVITGEIEEEWLKLTVEDQGVGIADVEKAMEPLYTTRPELERSGMGFLFMEAFMDEHDGLAGLAAVQDGPDRGADLGLPVLGEVAVVGLQVHAPQLLGDVVRQVHLVAADGVDADHVIPALDDFLHSVYPPKFYVAAGEGLRPSWPRRPSAWPCRCR